jgi:AAA+ superfamily predicted ATPase
MFQDIIKDMMEKSEEFNKEAKKNEDEINQLLKATLSEAKGQSLQKELSVKQTEKTAQKLSDKNDMTLEAAQEELDSLIGLEEIKTSIKGLVKRLEGQRILQEKSNIKIGKPNLHMIYSGPPGSGKTEVARIVARILHLLGYIESDKVIETDRSGLVGEHSGATAQKVMQKVNEAMDGVLFIDEAYALANNDGYGKEAIDTLIKAIEDYRDRFVVILAGYESEMDQLVNQNPGFKSRIPHRYRFKDYTPKELTLIAKKMLEDKGYKTKDINDTLENYINLQCKNGTLEGNARTIRNLVESVIQHHMIRIGEMDPDDLEMIHLDDIRNAIGLTKKTEQREGMDTIRQEALSKLDNLIGLDIVKKEVKRLLNFFAIQQKKRLQGIPTSLPEMNMVFSGGQGTGKTEVARIIGEILKGNGVLTNGHLKEVSRADLVGNVVGDTAQKVKKVVSESLGGILFIDRAYSLHSDDSYSAEALDTLIKEIDDNKGNIVVILAGYETEMNDMLDEVEGLGSRFRYHFSFNDYSPKEIFEITSLQLDKSKLVIGEKSFDLLSEKLLEMGEIPSNGRWATQFYEQLQITQSDRLMNEDSTDFHTITDTDIEETIKGMQ